MSALDDHLNKHRKRMLDRDRKTLAEVRRAYEQIERDLRRDYERLIKQIEEAKAAGETISPAWLYRERRLTLLMEQVKRRIEQFGRRATAITTDAQIAAIRMARDEALDIIQLLKPDEQNLIIGATLPTRAIDDAIGMIGDGSPILDYYREQLAPEVARAVRDQVIGTVATGGSIETLAAKLIAAGKITELRARIVARTETLRIRREAARREYMQIDGVEEWEWVASKSLRTCPACLALDGTRFKIDRPFPQHINCRCTIIPVVPGVERKRTLGRDWFDSLPQEQQAKIIGKQAAEAYSRGEVELKDFVGWRNHKVFGRSVRTRSLGEILSAGKSREIDR